MITHKNTDSKSMSQDDISGLQDTLIAKIIQKQASLRITQSQLADLLCVTPSYITAIFNATRWVPATDRASIKAIAKFLDVPLVQVLIWSGFLDAGDMIINDNLPARLDIIFEQISNDPVFRHVSPPKSEWENWQTSVKLRYVMMYEIAAGRALLDHAKMELNDQKLSGMEWILKKNTTEG